MSQETDNKISGSNAKVNDNAGFRTALLLNIPNYENNNQEMKELYEGMENVRLSCGDTPRLSDPKNEFMKNYISSDLLQRLEQYSPTKSSKSIDLKKMSDICLISCDKTNEEVNQPTVEKASVDGPTQEKTVETKETRGNPEKTRRGKVALEEEENSSSQPGEASDYERLRNFKLKTQVIKESLHQVMNAEEESVNGISSPYQNISNFSSIDQKGNTAFFEEGGSKIRERQNAHSPEYNHPQFTRKDSSPLYNYYDGTNKFLTQTMFRDKKESEGETPNIFGMGNSNNFIKKVGYEKGEGMCPIGIGGIFKKNDYHLDELINNSSPLDNTNSPFNSYFDAPINQFENQQGSSSMYFANNMRPKSGITNYNEFPEMNQMKENLEEDNINFSNLNNPTSNPGMWNMNNLRNQGMGNNGKTEDYSNFGQLMSGMQGNQGSKGGNKNALGGNGTGGNFGKKVPQNNSKINNFSSDQGAILQNQVGNMQVSNSGGNKNIANVNSVDNSDDYIVEMFGRKGWICDKCNNFNYETRIKCNRCGVAKCPKRNIKGKLGNKPEKNPQIAGRENNISFDGESSFDKKKKKPFVERVGDWVCIKCKNLNFSFRVVCNRCQLPKADSDKMFEAYMNNLMYYMKVNDMQNQMMMPNLSIPHQPQQQYIPPNNLVNNNSININNNYYNNTLNKGLMHMTNQSNQYPQTPFGGIGGALPMNNFNETGSEVGLYPWKQQAKPNPTANSNLNMQKAISMPMQGNQGMIMGPRTNMPTSMNMMNMNPMNMMNTMIPMNAMSNPFQMGGNNYENEDDDEEQY